VVYHLLLEADRQGKYALFILDIGNAQAYPPNAAAPAEKLKKAEVIEVNGE